MPSGLSIIIPTLNGGEVFRQSLRAIATQATSLPIEIIAIDSGSTDGTPEAAEAAGAKLVRIRPEEFSHSRTRNAALAHAKYDTVVFMVQDAVPVGDKWADTLASCISEGHAAAFGTSEPHEFADPYARFEVEFHNIHMGREPRVFALPNGQRLDRLTYDKALGLIRLDNVCSAYRKELLMETPFPDVPFGEDMAWARLALERGHSIKYDPSIRVRHSHNRPPEYRMKRSLVNSVACATILRRTKFDLSFLRMADMEAIRSRMQEAADSILASPAQTDAASNSEQRARGSGALSAFKFALRMIFDCSPGPIRRVAFGTAYMKAITSRLASDLALARRLTPAMSQSDARAFMDNAVASAFGKLAGDAYASQILTGGVEPALKSFAEPLMKGV